MAYVALTFAKNCQNALTYFSVFRLQYASDLRMFTLGTMTDVRQPLQSLLFGCPWPTYATVIHI